MCIQSFKNLNSELTLYLILIVTFSQTIIDIDMTQTRPKIEVT